MVRAWYMDVSDSDQRLPHQRDPPQPVSLEDLNRLTGVLHWSIDVNDEDNFRSEGQLLDRIRKERGYTYEDTITVSPDQLPNYQEKLKIFFTEHLHSDEEIRLVLDGSGYFDVRDAKNDEWIRIEVSRGDLIVLPAGIYHRFTLDTTNFIRVNRLFVGEPVWTPINRPADDTPARFSYIKAMSGTALSI